MSTVWYTSDLHLNHPLVARMRTGIDDPDRLDEALKLHNDMLADRWDSVVTKRDLVFVAGDLCISRLTEALAWINERPGRKRLVWGNHDAGHPANPKGPNRAADYRTAFEDAQPFYRVKVGGEDVLISHFPYTGDRGEDRWTQYRLPDLGTPLLHGHMHAEERIIDPSKPYQIHIGVDAWGLGPANTEEVRGLLREARRGSGPVS